MTVLTPTEITSKSGMAIVEDVLYGADAIVSAWVQSKMGEPPVMVPFQAFAVMPPDDEGTKKVLAQIENGEPPDFLAGAIFFNHDPGSDIYVTVAADDLRSAHPRVIRKILQYPFGQLDLPRISARIHASNKRCIENAVKLGFELEGQKRGTDWQMWGLQRSKCWVWNNLREPA